MSDGPLILNAAKNIKNSVNNENLEEVSRLTLNQILDNLLEISGPFARNAFILGNAFERGKLSNAVSVGNLSVKAFTKDGRNVLAQIDYASPIQKYIKDDIVAHVGKCIDDKCGDGTTSAMIFASSFVANMMKYKDYFGRITTAKLEELYKNITDKILKELDKYTFTEKDEITPEHIAYLQAYTSSGGMKNIANAVSSVIHSTPKELWKYAITQKYPKGESESDEPIKVVTEDAQYSCSVTMFNPEHLFKNIEGTLKVKDVKILVADYGLLYNDPLFEKLKDYIINKLDKPLVLITPSNITNNLEVINTIAKNNNKEVYIFGYIRPLHNNSNRIWALDALPIKANKLIANSELALEKDLEVFLIDAKSIFTNGKYLKIDGILDVEEGVNIHPVFKDKETYSNTDIYVNLLLKLLDEQLSLPDKDMFLINDIKKALSIVTSIYNTIIEVNGTAMDQQMISLILDDATKAAQHSLLSGMVFNGPYRLFQAIFKLSIDKLTNNDIRSVKDLCIVLLIKCLLQAAVDMVQSVYGPYSKLMDNTLPKFIDSLDGVDLDNKDSYYVVNTEFNAIDTRSVFNLGDVINKSNSFNYDKYQPLYSLDGTITINKGILDVLKNIKVDEIPDTVMPPCQPANLYKELFNRVRESGLRFAMVGTLIAPGTVWDDKLAKGDNNA